MKELILFTSKHCQPCRVMRDRLAWASVAGVHGPRLPNVEVIDVDEPYPIHACEEIRLLTAVPTIVLRVDGKVRHKWVGIVPIETIRAAMEEA